MTAPAGKVLAVVGTDTEVGKTLVTAAIARFLSRAGTDVGVFKPAESGCTQTPNGLTPSDALFLMRASRTKDSLALVNPYRFALPASPAAAARSAGTELSLVHVEDCLNALRKAHTITLIEGAGGLLVPFGDQWLLADFLQKADVATLVVARSRLGTINHCLLTISELERRKIVIAGVVLNQLQFDRGPEESLTPEAIAKISGVPVLGTMPFVEVEARTNPDALADIAVKHLDLSLLCQVFSLPDTEPRED